MTLERRILIANVLMVAIPVVATGVCALVCAAAIWGALSLGRGFDDTSDLHEAALAATAVCERALGAEGAEREERLSELDTLLDKTALSAEVREAGSDEPVYRHGELSAPDDELVGTARSLAGDGTATVEHAGRAVTTTSLEVGGASFSLAFCGDIRASASYADLKLSLVAAAIVLLACVLASTAFANRVVSDLLVRHFQEELARATGELERRDVARRQLIADISHDLRSPMTAIRGYAEGLLDGVAATPERQRRYLTTIVEKSDQVIGLLEGTLAFSKLELDDYPVAHERLRLDEEAAAAAREAAAGAAHVELTVRAEPTWAVADRALLARAVANLVENSEKYRAGEVAHATLAVRAEGGQALVEVSDDGPGVAEADLERIFEPFFRTDAARERPQDGSGMGLAFVRRAAELMGGRAWARTGGAAGGNGDGTDGSAGGLTVTIALPQAKEGAGGADSHR